MIRLTFYTGHKKLFHIDDVNEVCFDLARFTLLFYSLPSVCVAAKSIIIHDKNLFSEHLSSVSGPISIPQHHVLYTWRAIISGLSRMKKTSP